MGWLRLAVFLQLQVSFAKEPYKKTKFSRRDLQFERAYYPLTPNTSCLVHFETDIERDPPGGVYEKGGGGGREEGDTERQTEIKRSWREMCIQT